MLRAMSVSSLFGYGYEDVLEDYQHSDRICGRHTDRPSWCPLDWASGATCSSGASWEPPGSYSSRWWRRVDLAEMGWIAPEVISCMGYLAFYEGDLPSARSSLEQAWNDFSARPAGQTVSPLWPLPNDPVPVTAVALACMAGLQGRTGESLPGKTGLWPAHGRSTSREARGPWPSSTPIWPGSG